MKKGIVLLSTMLIFVSTGFGANISWKFGVSGDWAVGTNWVGDVAPGVGDYAIINAGVVTVTLTTTETIQGVRLITGTLNVMGLGTLNCTQGTTFPGIWHTSGALTNDGIINISMVTSQTGIQLQGTFTNNGTINISNVSNQGISALSGMFTNTGNLNIDNTLTANGNGLALGANFTNSGSVDIGGTSALGGHGISVNSGIILTNSGTINIDNITSPKNGISNSGTVNNMMSGSINIGVNTLIDGQGINNSGAITNSGDIVIDQIRLEAIFANASSTFSNTGNLKVNGGGTASMWVFTGSGTLTNTGTLLAVEDIVGGGFTNNGTISPGQSPGKLNIRNIYNSGAGAKYLAEIGGTTVETEYDQLYFYNSGAANFDISTTILEVQLTGGFTPMIGDAFDIMTSQFGYTGTFATPVLPALPTDREWMLDYVSDVNRLTLKVIAILPVKLTYFKANKEEGQALLSWQTASEVNNEGFEIQKSGDARNWATIGFAKGEGESFRSINYSFIDEHPSEGLNYYRLKQMDFDGEFEFSSIERLNFRSVNTTVNIFPNPSSGLFYIDVEGLGNETIRVFSADGKLLMLKSVEGNSIDLSSLPLGVYFLEINNERRRVVIQ